MCCVSGRVGAAFTTDSWMCDGEFVDLFRRAEEQHHVHVGQAQRGRTPWSLAGSLKVVVVVEQDEAFESQRYSPMQVVGVC